MLGIGGRVISRSWGVGSRSWGIGGRSRMVGRWGRSVGGGCGGVGVGGGLGGVVDGCHVVGWLRWAVGRRGRSVAVARDIRLTAHQGQAAQHLEMIKYVMQKHILQRPVGKI